MPGRDAPAIHLRPPTPADIPAMFQMQLDPEANRLAGTKPRTRETFDIIWAKILGDPNTPPDPAVTPRIILLDEATLVGMINIFPRDGRDFVGYWIHRDHWGRGIAGRALALLLADFPRRPVFAQVVAHNAASLRALERNGFTIISREFSPETERYTAGEVVTLELR
jgi:RimJ/RimL family protein N-acetyltransferase